MKSLLFNNWWSTLKIDQQIFFSIAIVFSLLAIILVILNLLGEELEKEETPSKKDRILDAKTTLVFLSSFGWAAVLFSFLAVGLQQIILFASFSALLITFIQGLFFGFPWKKELDVKKFLESTGEVLQSIPPHRNGTGKVQLAIRESSFELEALTSGQELLPGDCIRVIDIIDERVLVVEPIESKPPNL